MRARIEEARTGEDRRFGDSECTYLELCVVGGASITREILVCPATPDGMPIKVRTVET